MTVHELTPQQFRVAGMVADGLTDKDIGAQLHISPSVVAFHLAGIAKAWKLDPSKNRRAQITRRFLESTTKNPAA